MERAKKPFSRSNIDNIGDEVLVEILERLPIRLAHRCKCVSKHWLDIISSEYFGKTYNLHYSLKNQSSSRFALVIYREDNFKENFEFSLAISNSALGFLFDFVSLVPPPQLPLKKFRVLSSNNGLVLCSTTISEKQLYFVCNPMNKTWVLIPQPPSSTSQTHVVGFLCQAPFLSQNRNSKIHVDTRYSFRIVRFPNTLPILTAEIYTSETGEWSDYILTDNSSGNLSALLKEDFERKYVEQTVSIACKGLIYLKMDNCKELIVIDSNKGLFGSVKYPFIKEKETRDYAPYSFSECNGHLRCVKGDSCNPNLTIWELEDCDDIYAANWFLLQKVNLKQFKCSKGSPERLFTGSHYRNFSSVVFHPCNENLIFLRDLSGIRLCNIIEKTFSNVFSIVGRDNLNIFPIVLPWWPLSESRDNIKKVNASFEALIADLNLGSSSIPEEDDLRNRSSDHDIDDFSNRVEDDLRHQSRDYTDSEEDDFQNRYSDDST